MNEGHGGNLFANVLPWELDSAAILVRGFPKPLVMVTGIDSSFGTLMFTGAHANAGSPGVMAHNFAFDSFTVNGKVLNEVGINALIAGEMGVSVSLVSGDDVLIEETKAMLPNGFVAIVTKRAVGRSAAITYSPAKVRQMLQAGAAEAVRRERRGDFKPFTLDRPYRVEFMLRRSYPDSIVHARGGAAGVQAGEDRRPHLPLRHRQRAPDGLAARRHRRGGAPVRRLALAPRCSCRSPAWAQGQAPRRHHAARYHAPGRVLRRHRVSPGPPEAGAGHAARRVQRLHHRRHGGTGRRGPQRRPRCGR